MFRRLPDTSGDPVSLTIDGAACVGRSGDSVAALLLETGHAACRKSAVSGELRGPYCMMGVCFECLVEIDGIANRQACLMQIADGMDVRTGTERRRMTP
jgi:predicted molibdopterin-dependent oxidoreductase YjgC